MRDALVADLRLAGHQVTVLGDVRVNQDFVEQHATWLPVPDAQTFHSAFARAVDDADLAWLIAPEIAGAYEKMTQLAEARVELVSPSTCLVRLAGNKQATCEYLIQRGIASPRGRTWRVGQPIPVPEGEFLHSILKPNDGAGSESVQRLQHKNRSKPQDKLRLDVGRLYRVEEWIEGQPYSVAILGGKSDFIVLEPCHQHISADGSFSYEGGSFPVESPDRDLLIETATGVAQVLPKWKGFIGLDIVLGPTGAVVIEINPRLTASYLGLRKFYWENLAKTVLDSLNGSLPSLSSRNFQLQFDPYGESMCRKVDKKDATAACKWQPWTSEVPATNVGVRRR